MFSRRPFPWGDGAALTPLGHHSTGWRPAGNLKKTQPELPRTLNWGSQELKWKFLCVELFWVVLFHECQFNELRNDIKITVWPLSVQQPAWTGCSWVTDSHTWLVFFILLGWVKYFFEWRTREVDSGGKWQKIFASILVECLIDLAHFQKPEIFFVFLFCPLHFFFNKIHQVRREKGTFQEQ